MRIQHWVRLVALVIAVTMIAMPASALGTHDRITYDPMDEIPDPTGFERALTKLGRGLSNIMLGWAEIPLAMDRSIKDGESFGHLIGVAPVLGTARAIMRTTTGVFEAVTFPFSDYDVNYEAVLEPEFIF